MEQNETIFIINKRVKEKKISFILKNIIDSIISIILIIALSPLFIIIAVIIKIDSEGPVIFKQIRVGKNNEEFLIYKFRTMVKDAEKNFSINLDKDNIGSFIFQDKNDTRITKIGKILRKTSLDELPQLFNVLIGNMSLVGPRPEIPSVAQYYNEHQKLRLCVKPGITGLAQVSGRGEIELDKTIGYDIEYIKKFSLLLDLIILIRTVSAVFKREGAY